MYFVVGALEDFGHRSHIDAKRQISVAAIEVEAVSAQHHGDQRDVARVHGLQAETE